MFFNKIANFKKAAMFGFAIAAFSTNGNAMDEQNPLHNITPTGESLTKDSKTQTYDCQTNNNEEIIKLLTALMDKVDNLSKNVACVKKQQNDIEQMQNIMLEVKRQQQVIINIINNQYNKIPDSNKQTDLMRQNIQENMSTTNNNMNFFKRNINNINMCNNNSDEINSNINIFNRGTMFMLDEVGVNMKLGQKINNPMSCSSIIMGYNNNNQMGGNAIFPNNNTNNNYSNNYINNNQNQIYYNNLNQMHGNSAFSLSMNPTFYNNQINNIPNNQK